MYTLAGKSAWLVILCTILLSNAAVGQDGVVPSAPSGPGCLFGEVTDGSTANDARRKIEAAGFTDVHDLKKGCDNFWHGRAVWAGLAVNVVLSPNGNVMLESQ